MNLDQLSCRDGERSEILDERRCSAECEFGLGDGGASGRGQGQRAGFGVVRNRDSNLGVRRDRERSDCRPEPDALRTGQVDPLQRDDVSRTPHLRLDGLNKGPGSDDSKGDPTGRNPRRVMKRHRSGRGFCRDGELNLGIRRDDEGGGHFAEEELGASDEILALDADRHTWRGELRAEFSDKGGSTRGLKSLKSGLPNRGRHGDGEESGDIGDEGAQLGVAENPEADRDGAEMHRGRVAQIVPGDDDRLSGSAEFRIQSFD